MSYLFKNCRILETRDGKFHEITDGFLGVDGDVIDYIGESRPEKKYDEERDMTGKLLMPGLINAHSHAPMTLLRGVGSDLPLQEWLFDNVFPIEDKLTEEDVEVGTRLAILEMLAGGTTSFSDMYFLCEGMMRAVSDSGMKANISRTVQSTNESKDPRENRRARESLELFDKYHGAENGRIKIDFSLHAEYTCETDLAEMYSRVCKQRGGTMHLHLSETQKEQRECIERHGITPAAWFESVGAFDSPALAAHCVAVTDDDIAILKKHGVGAVHNPTSNMKMGSGFAPVQKLLDAGITVGLGTDGAASNNNVDMFEEMHLAAVIHNGYSGDPTVMKPADVLKMATVNGARLQGRYDTGELIEGKKADIIAVRLTSPHMRPNRDTLALLCYSAQSADVCMTMVDGRILYENGRFFTMDAEKIYEAVEQHTWHLKL